MPALALACALSGAAPAQALEVEARLGLDHLVGGSWAPLEVDLQAGPDERRAGEVAVTFTGARLGRCSTSFSLAPGQAHTVRLEVPVLPGHPYEVRVEDERGALLAQVEPTSWEVLDPDVRWVAVVEPAVVQALLALRDADRPRVSRVGAGALAACSERVLASLTAVVVPLDPRDADVGELLRDRAALDRLEHYVRQGGRLVLVAAAGAPAPPDELQGLLPLRDPRPVPIQRRTLSPLLGEAEVDVTLPALRGELVPGARWLYEAGDHGLVAERPLGDGAVLLVTVDPDALPARAAPHLPRILGQVVGRRAPVRQPELSRMAAGLEGVARAALEARAPLSVLGFGLVAAALLVHVLILGPLAVRWGRRRGPWSGLLLPPLVSSALALVVFALAALSRGGPGEVRSLELAVQRGLSPPAVRAELGLVVQESGRLEVELPRHWSPVLRGRSLLEALHFRERPPALRFGEGARLRFGPLRLSAGDVTRVGLEGPGEPLAYSLRAEGEGQWRLRCEEPPLAAIGLRLADGEVRWGPLSRAASGSEAAEARWSVAGAERAFTGEGRPRLERDPFAGEGGDELLAAMGQALAEAGDRQAPHERARVADDWLLLLTPSPGPAAEVAAGADGEQQPLPLRALRVTAVPLGAP